MNQIEDFGILSSDEIDQFWYKSLEISSVFEGSEFLFDIWKKLVLKNGNVPIPVGFVAILLTLLAKNKVNFKYLKTTNQIEINIINLFKKSTVFSQLEGEFIAKNNKITEEQLIKAFNIILGKLNYFYHPKIKLYDKYIKYNKNNLENNSNLNNFKEIILSLYQKAWEYLLKQENVLLETDLFEIKHYKLFSGENLVRMRFIYQIIYQSYNLIKSRLISQITLKTENDKVIKDFSEPQLLLIGGYDSLTNKGELSSLVPSELAYIDDSESFDYFDYKYLQKELLYYKREEGSVFRIRRQFHIFLEINSEMELDKNLAILLAFLLALSEKITSIYQKDIVLVNIYLEGFLPTSIQEALDFFKHFIEESSLQNNVKFFTSNNILAEINKNLNYQHIIISKGNNIPQNIKNIIFDFPSGDFNFLDILTKSKILANHINKIIEESVNVACS